MLILFILLLFKNGDKKPRFPPCFFGVPLFQCDEEIETKKDTESKKVESKNVEQTRPTIVESTCHSFSGAVHSTCETNTRAFFLLHT